MVNPGRKIPELKIVDEPSPGDGKYWEQIQRNGKHEYVIYTPAHRNIITKTESLNYDSFLMVDEEKYSINYHPMKIVPWALCNEPTEYGPELWDEIYHYVLDHVYLPDIRLYDVVTAWVFYTWIPEAFTVAPYLRLLGKKNVGKTRLLEVLYYLTYRGTLTPSITEAVLFRFLQDYKITYLLDETEIYGSETKQAIQHVLNAGYRRGQFAFRMEKTETGKYIPVGFNVFGPKALAGTRTLKDTLESRCIQIVMEKNPRDRPVNFMVDTLRAKRIRNKLLLYRFRRLADLDQLSEDSELSEISEGYNEAPPELHQINNSRIIELYSPLITLAETEPRQNIIDYAVDSYKRSQVEETDTYEAQILLAIREIHHLESGKFSTRQVTDTYNQSRPEIEHIKVRTVGRIIKKLGFEPKRMTGGHSGYIFDLNRVNNLSEEYGIPILDSPSLPSLTSLTSPKEVS
ncbi:hypothetical protein ACFL0D_06925 [Thermoproteota archaeon]